MYQMTITTLTLLIIIPSLVYFVKKSTESPISSINFNAANLKAYSLLASTYTYSLYKSHNLSSTKLVLDSLTTKLSVLFLIVWTINLTVLFKKRGVKLSFALLAILSSFHALLSNSLLPLFFYLECSSLVFFLIILTEGSFSNKDDISLKHSGAYSFISISFMFSCLFSFTINLLVFATSSSNLSFLPLFKDICGFSLTLNMAVICLLLKAGLVPFLLYKLDVYKSLNFSSISMYVVNFFWLYSCIVLNMLTLMSLEMPLPFIMVGAIYTLLLHYKFMQVKELIALGSSFTLLTLLLCA